MNNIRYAPKLVYVPLVYSFGQWRSLDQQFNNKVDALTAGYNAVGAIDASRVKVIEVKKNAKPRDICADLNKSVHW